MNYKNIYKYIKTIVEQLCSYDNKSMNLIDYIITYMEMRHFSFEPFELAQRLLGRGFLEIFAML